MRTEALPDFVLLVVSDHGFRPRHELFQQQNRADLNVQALLGRLGLKKIEADGRTWSLVRRPLRRDGKQG